MKRIITVIMTIVLALTMALPASANGAGATVFTEEHTVVWSETDGTKLKLITTTEYEELATADQISPAFYFEISALSSATQLLSDGTEKGDELLKLAAESKKIPAGTVITLQYGGVDDSYPSQITPSKVTFCEKRTTILLSQALPIIDVLNGLSESEKYSISNEERGNFRTLSTLSDEENTIGYFTVIDSKYNEKTEKYSVTMTRREQVSGGDGTPRYTTASLTVSKDALTHDGSSRGAAQFEKLSDDSAIDVGTVLEIHWDGVFMETYPAQLCAVTEVKITGIKTDLTDSEIKSEAANVNGLSDGDFEPSPAPPIPTNVEVLDSGSSADDNDRNPATGVDTVFAGAALIGILAWVVSLISIKRENSAKNK